MSATSKSTPTRRRRLTAAWLAAGWITVAAPPSTAADAVHEATASVETDPSGATGDSVDDSAIWINTVDPERSLVIGADHGDHGIDVYDLSGTRIQRIDTGDANNLDIRDGFPLAGTTVPVVTVAGGGHSGGGLLRFFTIDPATLELENVTAGGEFKVPSAHGACMYHSGVSGKFYAFRVAPSGTVEQYELFDDGGLINARSVRPPIDVDPFPINENSNDAIEGCAADDVDGNLFVGEQDYGIWKYGAEPTDPVDKESRVLVDGTIANGGHIQPDIEGMTVVHEPGGGFLIASSQGDDSFNVYRRQAPHEFVRKVRIVGGSATDNCERTDGVEAAFGNLGPAFPQGLFVCQDNRNSEPAAGNQNFKFVRLETVVPLGDAPPGTLPPGSQPPTSQPPTSQPPGTTVPGSRSGYWMLGTDGRVYAFGDARPHGEPGAGLRGTAVDLEPTPSGDGYWILDRAGTVHVHGDAAGFGNVDRLAAGEEATSLSATPSGRGYWVFTNFGRVVTFGDARSLGDMSGTELNEPVLDSIATPSGVGYYMVAADGGIFAFGDAAFHGSMGGVPLNAPVQSLVPDPDRRGYWLVASDGGVFAFDAGFRGSMGGVPLNAPVTGMVTYGGGYLMVATDGGLFNFSDEPFRGSLGADPPSTPIIAVAAL